MNTYLYTCLGSFALVILSTPAVIWLAVRIGAMDRPGARTVHERPIARIGGVAVFCSAMTAIIFVILLNNSISVAFRTARVQLIALLSSATLVFTLGLVDDLKVLPARVKFLVELLLATVLYFVGVRISEVTLLDGWTVSLGSWSYVLTILWIVGVTNAVNLCDGLDGLAAGICCVACGVIALFAFLSGSVIMGVFMLALLGSLCGFLVFNFYPARVFLGDCGSLFLGFIIAASGIMCMMKSATLAGLAMPALALGIPIFDTLFSMLRRFLERRSLFAPDQGHFHHRLLELGLGQRCAVLIIYGVTLVVAGLGLLILVSDGTVHSLFVFGGALLLLVLVFRAAGVVQVRDILVRLQRRRVFARRERDERAVFEDRQLQFRQIRNVRHWWPAVCQTARQMGFAWVLLKTTYEDGRIEEELWGIPPVQPDLSRILTMAIPLNNGAADAGVSRRLEIAIYTNGSIESVSRRATLFGRLVDECGPRAGTRDPMVGMLGKESVLED